MEDEGPADVASARRPSRGTNGGPSRRAVVGTTPAVALGIVTLTLPEAAAASSHDEHEEDAAAFPATLARSGSLVVSGSPGIGEITVAAIAPDGGHAYFGYRNGTQDDNPDAVILGFVSKVPIVDGELSAEWTQNGVVAGVLGAAVIQPDGAFGYFATSTSPATIVKVRLSDLTPVASLVLGAEDGGVRTAAVDAAGEFGFFGTNTSPGRVVRIRLSSMAQEGTTLVLGTGEDDLAAVTSNGSSLFFGTGTSPARVVEVRMSDLSRQGGRTFDRLAVDEPRPENIRCAVNDGTYAYFGTAGIGAEGDPQWILRVRMSDRTGSPFALPSEVGPLWSAVTDGVHAYFGTGQSPGRVHKVLLAPEPTLVSSLTLDAGEEFLATAVTNGTQAYFGLRDASPARVVTV